MSGFAPRVRGSVAIVLALACGTSLAQYNERAHPLGSRRPGVDCSGRSIKNMRVRGVHTEDPSLRGGTAYLLQKDPFLAYQLGRNLNFREFRPRDGVFDASISGLGGPMPDGTTAKITTNNHTSCSGCHNLPQGNPGGGVNFHKDSGFGRNSPHYYGTGIMEMLGLQIRTDMLRQLDRNQDGWINAEEAAASKGSVRVRATSQGPWIDFGDPSLSEGRTGEPSLNNIFRVWYVDRAGKVVPGATSVDGAKTFGYNFEMIVFGWGQGAGRAALNPTNRAFLWDPWKSHGGLEADDPTTNVDPDADGISGPTLAGALQFPVTHATPDKGKTRDRLGFSRDDPDRDGYLTEISEGDLDLAEWFMLNAARPAFAGTSKEYEKGIKEMSRLGCTECHVAEWQIHAKDTDNGPLEGARHRYAGDRRLFDLDVSWNKKQGRIEGRLVRLYDKVGDRYVRKFGSFHVRGLFTDFRHHFMGEGFAEIDFGGVKNTVWRTAPLWGVGSGFPWGHDGRSLTLEDAILRHGGEAQGAKTKWLRANGKRRQRVLSFLRKLVLYDVESLPADIDGDGRIASNFIVAGVDTGPERFNAEWLFRVPLQIQGLVRNVDGEFVRSFAGVNVDQAYGQQLPLRHDTDGDGWPDVWDHAPGAVGYRDGVK